MTKLPIRILIWFIPILFLGSCSQTVTISEFQAWFSDPENGYIKMQEINPLQFKATYRPTELLIAYEMERDPNASLKDLQTHYQGSYHFLLEIGWNSNHQEESSPIFQFSNGYEEYTTKVKEYAFNMGEYLRLITGSDTLVPAITHFEQGYELAKSQTIIIAFDKPKGENSDKLRLIFDDKVFGTGRHKFNFKTNQENIPALPNISNTI